MGKGKGKGGCGILEGIGDCIQCIAGTICCLCVSGPILIIVGIIFIVTAFDDSRSQRIDEFNVAVDAWNSGAVDDFNVANNTDWTYSLSNPCGSNLNSVQLLKSEPAEVLGFEADERSTFGSYPRVTYYQPTPQAFTAAECTVSFAIFFQTELIGNVTTQAVTDEDVRFSQICSQSSGSSSNSAQRNAREREDVRRCEGTCRGRGGIPTGSTITTFTCRITEVPSEVCVRVTKTNGEWAFAQGTLPERPSGASGKGCFISNPGSSRWEEVAREGVSSTSQLNVPVRVRHERDPYLYFVDISDGTLDFGLKTSEKLIIGFTCLGLGIVITALVCGCCCFIVKFARSFAKGDKEKPSNPVGAALYDVSAKYGNYIPGGTAMGQPVSQGTATGMPAANVHKPPAGYNGDSYDTGQYSYGAGAPYTPGPGGASYSSTPYGGGGAPSQPPPYGGPAQPPPYGGPSPSYGGNNQAGAPPPGYPAAV